MTDPIIPGRCPRQAVFAINGRDRTRPACPDHLIAVMTATEQRDGIGVFWRSDGGQCFTPLEDEEMPAPPTCSVCGIQRGPDHPDSDHPWQWNKPRIPEASCA